VSNCSRLTDFSPYPERQCKKLQPKLTVSYKKCSAFGGGGLGPGSPLYLFGRPD